MLTGMSRITPADIAALLASRATPGRTHLVGVTGSVASGKSTLVAALKEALPARTEAVSTDGFLFPNAVLAERDLLLRKGFPESYDAEALLAVLAAVHDGPVTVPGYSHVIYDVDPALTRTIDRPDTFILEGLGFAPLPDGRRAGDRLDALVYLDAEEADLETWFVDRFIGFWRAAEADPASFYAQFRTMSQPDAETFARRVWHGINLPNLREHIVHARDHADIVIRKGPDHGLTLVRGG